MDGTPGGRDCVLSRDRALDVLRTVDLAETVLDVDVILYLKTHPIWVSDGIQPHKGSSILMSAGGERVSPTCPAGSLVWVTGLLEPSLFLTAGEKDINPPSLSPQLRMAFQDDCTLTGQLARNQYCGSIVRHANGRTKN